MKAAATLKVLVLLSLVLFFIAPTAAQTEIVYGTVTHVNARDTMVEIRVDVERKTITVELAPSSFLDQYNFMVKEGDAVSLHLRREGSGDKARIVATEISKASRRLNLRDDQGRPLW